jgi:hypothetical protein
VIIVPPTLAKSNAIIHSWCPWCASLQNSPAGLSSMIHFFGKEAFFTRGLLLTATLLVFSGLLHFVIVLEAPSSIYDVLVM